MANHKDYRLTVKVRNNRILKAIEAVGGTPGGKWCAANGLNYVSVNELINLTSSPLNKVDGTLTLNASLLCDVLGKLPEDLWSNEQLYPLVKNFSEMEMDYGQVCALLPSSEQSYLPDFSEMEEAETTKLVDEALGCLTSREAKVLRLRFYEDMTLAAIGEQLGVQQERVRQIEAKALRKLRHPRLAEPLSELVDMSDAQRKSYRIPPEAARGLCGG